MTNLFGYNAKGEQEYSAIDLNNDGYINTDSTSIDRVTRTISDVVTNSAMSANVRRTRTYVWVKNNDSTATLVSTTETSTNGLKTWNTIWNNGVGATNKTQTVYAGSGNRYVTNTAPDGSYTVSAFTYGLPSPAKTQVTIKSSKPPTPTICMADKAASPMPATAQRLTRSIMPIRLPW